MLHVKRGDAGTKIRATLLDRDGSPVDLTGCSVRFIMRAPSAAGAKVDAPAAIEDAAAGTVAYTWAASDLDTPGTYHAEWQVTFGAGAVQTFPSDQYLIVKVLADLGG